MIAKSSKSDLVEATILFADLINSVGISAVLDFWSYDELIEEYQKHLSLAVKEASRPGDVPVAEEYIAGDQLAVFFYDPEQVEKNERMLALPEGSEEKAKLQAECKAVCDSALFGALRTAIMLKNSWLSTPLNVERVKARHLPFDVGVGIHRGMCVLRERADGTKKIEGFAINFAKRIEGYARIGRVTQVMLSRGAVERLRFVRRKQVVMRQRLGFISHEPAEGELKGLQAGLQLFELKFFHRLMILPEPERIPVFEELLRMDPKNVWAYQMAAEHYAYRLHEYDKARELALIAKEARPDSEKVYYDLAHIAMQKGELDLAAFFAERAHKLNSNWDIPYGLLSEIETEKGNPHKALEYQRIAYGLVPDSPQNCWDLGITYLHVNDSNNARKYLTEAIKLFPAYLEDEQKLKIAKEVGAAE